MCKKDYIRGISDNVLSPRDIRLNDGFPEGWRNIFQVPNHENRKLFYELEQLVLSPLITVENEGKELKI